MGILRIIIGAIVGSIISVGGAIGLIYGGIQVSWWLGLILALIGIIIGGFVAGWIAQDRFPGMIAGFVTGLFVFGGIVLFFYLVLRVKVEEWYIAAGSDISVTISSFLTFFSINPTSSLGTLLTETITTKYNFYSGDIALVIADYIPKFSLVLGAIFGSFALIINTIAGRIGGRLNKIDEITGN
ncbi:MAG: hypothetical protein ACTSXA_16050 [Candidatus Heimdallarchaeota archaeon]